MRDRKSSKRGNYGYLDTVRGGNWCFAIAAVSLLSEYLIVKLICDSFLMT
jgi:hypothetical protein